MIKLKRLTKSEHGVWKYRGTVGGKRVERWAVDYRCSASRKRRRALSDENGTPFEMKKHAMAFKERIEREHAGVSPKTARGKTFGSALGEYLRVRINRQGRNPASYIKLVRRDQIEALIEGDPVPGKPKDRPTADTWYDLFHGQALDSIDRDRVETVMESWEDGISDATFNNVLSQLSGLLTYSTKKHWIRSNPCRDIERPSIQNARKSWIRPAQLEKLVAVAEPWAHPILRFAWVSGIRRSKLLGLRRADVLDVGDGQLAVLIERDKNGEAIWVPLQGPVRTLVERQMAKCASPDDLLFPSSAGRGGADTELKQKLPLWVKAAGMKWGRYKTNKNGKAIRDKNGDRIPQRDGITFHSFRHSMASNALAAGVSREELRKMGGWKTDVMVNRYAKVDDPQHRRAAAKLADLLPDAPVVTVPPAEA